MHHSRAAALLIWDYFDRPIDVFASASAITAGAIIVTYTIGANIQSRLEASFILITGGVVNGTAIAVQINRMGVNQTLNILYSNGGVPYIYSTMSHDLLLQAGDTVILFYITPGVVFVQGGFSVREIDL